MADRKPPFHEARRKMTKPVEYSVPLIPKKLTIYELIGFGGILAFVIHLFPILFGLVIHIGTGEPGPEILAHLAFWLHWGAFAVGAFCLLLAWIQRTIQYAKEHPDWDASDEDR
jgi:hypothetical protein